MEPVLATFPLPLRLVVACARVRLSTSEADTIRTLANDPSLNWREVGRLAVHHQTLPLLHHHLQALQIGPPEPFASVFREHARTAALQNMILVEQLKRIQAPLDEAGLPCISFKGPVLATQAYRSLALRVCTDLDLLVRPQDLPRLGGIVTAHGFMPGAKLQQFYGFKRRFFLYLSQQATFVHRTNQIHLDVHVGLAPPLYAYPTRFEVLYDRGIDMKLSGVTVRTFSPEDALVLLCLHGEKNRWEYLKYVCDIAAVLESHPELDWDTIARRSKEMRGRRIVLLGLKFAQVLLDAPVPPAFLEPLKRESAVQQLSTTLLDRLSSMDLSIADFEKRFWLHLHTQDSLKDRLRYLSVAFLRYVWDRQAA